MSWLSRMPETPNAETVINKWEISDAWKKRTEMVEDKDGYTPGPTVEEVANDVGDIEPTPEGRADQAAKVLDSEETKSITEMFDELVDVFEHDDEWKFSNLRGEYRELTSNIMNAYNSTIEEKTNTKIENNEDNNLSLQYVPETREARNRAAETILSHEPEHSDQIISDMQDVFENWTPEQKQMIYWIINSEEFSGRVKQLFDRVNSKEK